MLQVKAAVKRHRVVHGEVHSLQSDVMPRKAPI